MSATLNPSSVSNFLGNCPSVESSGRSFPVEVKYLQFAPSKRIEETVARGVRQMLNESDGDILVFLPGVGEIRQTQELLRDSCLADGISLLPLYGEMPLEEQQRVLGPSRERRIILATNLAETSLTVAGISAVVDSGLSRVNRLDPRLGLNRLDLGRISKASAEQRAGRAGRTSAGACLRLWTEREHLSLPDFEAPEISRVDLSECALQLLAWGESDLFSFPWFEPPAESELERALQLLEQLGATENGALSSLGKSMAKLPLQPRMGRLLLEALSSGLADRAALCAALLSEREAFKRAKERKEAEHKSDSDVLDRLQALEDYLEQGFRDSFLGQIHPAAAKQISRSAEQLKRIISGSNEKDALNSSAAPQKQAQDEALLKALLAAFPDRVCKRREARSRRALMLGGRGVKLAEESAVNDADLFLAVELLESNQAEAMVRQASRIERDWLPQSLITTGTEVSYDSDKQKVIAFKRSRYYNLILEESVTSIPAGFDCGEVLAAAIEANFDIDALIDDDSKSYLARLKLLQKSLPELELPELKKEIRHELLLQWCMGCSSIAELKERSLIPIIQSLLSHKQIQELELEAPEKLLVPSGNRIKIDYCSGDIPILAVRIQELFGLRETPRIARNRVSLLMHLLAPNFRVQQITPDLGSFWKNTYLEVRKDLKARYPKHSWPDNPLTAQAEKGAKKRAT
ncbi:MAG: hypothetical protein K2X27_01740 [Candidatus Obscuribacterales bacterium]|nr:hypothetical protein [Candidatus Obscuribacterales bacterium]